jgi:hypothetical protein
LFKSQQPQNDMMKDFNTPLKKAGDKKEKAVE